ncbi:SMI1/KNR4 family protein [Saccharophagus degradans]|uniref:SMI1/KNR4 family protein n=1 Tax=Saccharophagus degradans TaxID=86304 RepID=UPI002477D2E3|nr:SMI1/KNR4 family protein [Saccharophagus degradans]WGO96996.1 SMI1/KNR4 family protein [Saccharophagus degradans]
MINEIAEILAARSLKTAYPLELPTMDDIVEAHEAMLISVPADFRGYLLHSSNCIYGRLEPVTVADRNSHTYLPEVAAEAWSRGMPREMIPLCVDGDNVYCVAEDGEVFLWEGDDDMESVAEDVWQWVRDVWLES